MIEVTTYTEHEDGSVTVTLDMDPKDMQIIFQVGFNKILEETLEKIEEK